MEKYYYLDSTNTQHGPLDASELAANGVTAQTFVWREGMAEWQRAGELPELAAYIAPAAPGSYGSYGAQPAGGQPQYAPGSQQKPQFGYFPGPSSNLVWAILTTIFCCMPAGIYAIICAAKVDTLWESGRQIEAREMSKRAALWSWIAAGISVLGWVLYYMFFAAAAASSILRMTSTTNSFM